MLAGSWVVVNKQGFVVRAPVNTPKVDFFNLFSIWPKSYAVDAGSGSLSTWLGQSTV